MGRILALLLTVIILAVTVEAAEAIWPTDLDDQKWNFEKARGWGDFARINENSAELVIGLTKGKDDTCTKLSHLITVNGGKIKKTISTKKEVLAIVAEIPFDLIPAFVLKVKATDLAKYIEPNLRVQAESLPNDPYWNLQWGPKKIEADWAWNATLGNSSVLVAVIDYGIDDNHTDLAANYVALGYNWANNNSNVTSRWNHGTHIAGIIAAVTNNSEGIAGLAQVKVMAEKVFDEDGNGYVDWAAQGIIHATNQSAKVISISLSTDVNDSLLYEAVKYAYEENVLLVAAAGSYENGAKAYPAAYDEVIAVTATYSNDNPWFAYDGNWIELAAPGVDIYSTTWRNGYGNMSGTSMACPHVSGLAALLWSEFPNATRDWIRYRLRETADDLGDHDFDNYYGYGRINARKAMSVINYTLAITTTSNGTTNPAPGNHTYTEGQNVSVQARPDPGYSLNYWEVDGENVGSANPYWVFMESNHTLKAVFVLSYTLTITTTTGGTTSPSPGSYPYNLGTNVSVTATSDTYYIFDHWELDEVNIGSVSPYLVLMDNNYTLHAVFVQINYTLTITATAGGTTNPEPGICTYPAGSIISVTAIAIPDTNVLDYWELDDDNIGATNPISVTMDANHTLHAIFREGLHDVAITNVTSSKSVVGQGYSTNITVTIANQGDFTEIFNVTLYVGHWNETRTIYLPNGMSTTLTFTWNTTGFAKGNYTIWAYAEPVLGETDTEDNTLSDGWVFVSIPGDLNVDKKVNILDAITLSNNFGENPDWNPNADINNDRRVNILDCVILSNYFGQSWT